MGDGSFAQHYVQEAVREFQRQKRMVERSVAQVDAAAFFATLDPESNSIAILVKHIAGNMRSRWTDFLTTDGEKPDRHRDSEFIIEEGDSQESLMVRWDASWAILFAAMETVDETTIQQTITIRGEPHSVVQAINRQLTHYSYHVGQIVLLAKHAAGDRWQTLSVARGRSDDLNAAGGTWLS